jgi:hypothetical protein
LLVGGVGSNSSLGPSDRVGNIGAASGGFSGIGRVGVGRESIGALSFDSRFAGIFDGDEGTGGNGTRSSGGRALDFGLVWSFFSLVGGGKSTIGGWLGTAVIGVWLAGRMPPGGGRSGAGIPDSKRVSDRLGKLKRGGGTRSADSLFAEGDVTGNFGGGSVGGSVGAWKSSSALGS